MANDPAADGWAKAAFRSVIQALNRVVYGRPGRQAKIPRAVDQPARPAGPWATAAGGGYHTQGEPLDYPPLQVVRKSQELTKIYAELVRVSAERENRYKDYEDMILDATIAAAIELMVDDACQFNRERSASVWVKTDDDRIRRAIEELFDVVQLEEKLFDWAFNMSMYGDFFLEVEGQEGRGVRLVQDDWHPADVQRLDVNGALIGFRTPRTFVETTQVSAAGVIGDSDFHDPWDFVHFRIQASQRRRREIERERMAPMIRFEKDRYRLTTRYGVSVVEAVRRIYKQLAMVEQSMIISRMTRAILKYIYKVQCGKDAEMKGAVNTVLQMKDLLTQQTGLKIGESFDQVFAPLSGSEDVFLPVFGERGDVTIETLGGENNVQAIVDIEYLRNKMFGGIKIPKAYLGLEECCRGITRVSMLDGTTPTIEEITDDFARYEGRHVYTCSPDGRVSTSPIVHAKKTRLNATFVRVHLDNGEHVDFTPDHPMMLRDGTFRGAGELQPGDSLMPLYTRVAEEGAYKGYRLVKQNTEPGGWEPEYRLAARDALLEGEIPDGVMVHHRDGDKLNDDPSNLEPITKSEHYARHKEMIDRVCMVPGREIASTDEVKRRRAEALRRPEVREKISAAGRGRRFTEEHRRRIAEANRGKRKPWMVGEKNVMHRSDVRERWLTNMRSGNEKRRIKVLVERPCERCGKIIGKCYVPSKAKSVRFCGPVCTGKHAAAVRGDHVVDAPYNHKVVRVEKLDVVEDAYDLGVAHENHTFALAAGIFVHNSLPGSLGESALLRLDIRYARTVKRIQRAVIQGLTRLAQIHLAYKHLPVDLKRFSIEMDVISTAEEEERKASLSSALAVAGDLTRLNTEMRIGLPPKKFAKLVYGEVLGLSGKFMELVSEAEVLPPEGAMEGPPGGMEGGVPGAEGAPAEPAAPEVAPEGELEPPPEGAAEGPPGPEEPAEGGLEPPPGVGEPVVAGEKRRYSRGKSLQERQAVEDAKRPVETAAREAKLSAGIVADAKRQAQDAVTRAVRQSTDVRAETPEYDHGGHRRPSIIEHYQKSDDLRKVLEFAVTVELEEKKREAERRRKAIAAINEECGQIQVAVAAAGKR